MNCNMMEYIKGTFFLQKFVHINLTTIEDFTKLVKKNYRIANGIIRELLDLEIGFSVIVSKSLNYFSKLFVTSEV